jgi:ubiquinone/menaquinone biosynthesis C-methylase UbiE
MNNSDEVKQQKQQTWAAGDYSRFGSKLVIVSELLCETVDLRANHRVLDVATGHGNTALAAARRGCVVTGIDFTLPLLEQARQRAAAEHLQIDFQEGDLEAIPFPDETFDIVLSTFGVMFSTDPRKTARELLRVCRAGGKLGLVSWTPTGANVAEDQAMEKYFPTPPDTPPNLWLTADGLQALFGDQVASLQVNARSVIYRFASIEAYVDTAFNAFGPLMKMVQALSQDERTRLKSDLVAALSPSNQSGDETLVLPFDYIEAVVTKPARP